MGNLERLRQEKCELKAGLAHKKKKLGVVACACSFFKLGDRGRKITEDGKTVKRNRNLGFTSRKSGSDSKH